MSRSNRPFKLRTKLPKKIITQVLVFFNVVDQLLKGSKLHEQSNSHVDQNKNGRNKIGRNNVDDDLVVTCNRREIQEAQIPASFGHHSFEELDR